jgi:anti-anti-sigma factor
MQITRFAEKNDGLRNHAGILSHGPVLVAPLAELSRRRGRGSLWGADSGLTVTAPAEECTQWTLVELHGILRAPADMTLCERVEALLRGGQRQIVLDLAPLSAIDAAGVGELIRAYNMATGAGGVMRIARAKGRVGHLLEVAGVLRLFSSDR